VRCCRKPGRSKLRHVRHAGHLGHGGRRGMNRRRLLYVVQHHGLPGRGVRDYRHVAGIHAGLAIARARESISRLHGGSAGFGSFERAGVFGGNGRSGGRRSWCHGLSDYHGQRRSSLLRSLQIDLHLLVGGAGGVTHPVLVGSLCWPAGDFELGIEGDLQEARRA
jgi:hypothetical protein